MESVGFKIIPLSVYKHIRYFFNCKGYQGLFVFPYESQVIVCLSMGAGGIGMFVALPFMAEILFACCWGGGSLARAGATGVAGVQWPCRTSMTPPADLLGTFYWHCLYSCLRAATWVTFQVPCMFRIFMSAMFYI